MNDQDLRLRDMAERFEARRRELARAADARTIELEARFLAQTSHFTTPASNLETIKKAAQGIPGASRLLERLSIAPGELAETFGVERALVESVLATRSGPPLLMIDGEDATALDPEVARLGRANAVEALATIEWGSTLAFYRPSGLALETCVPDLVEVVSGARARTAGQRFPLDGIVWPKARHEDELAFVADFLGELERRHGLERASIKVAFLIESGRALARLERLVDAIRERLVAVIWGSADYAADVGLPRLENAHPAFDAARSAIVNIAGSIGVAPIDNMTFDFPVRDPSLDAAGQKRKILASLRTCFDEARHGIALGMEGKWVGHPLQLVASEVAARASFDAASIERDVAEVRAYLAATRSGRGAAVIAGAMADRATDRHLRRRLRRAFARGLLAPEVARELLIAP